MVVERVICSMLAQKWNQLLARLGFDTRGVRTCVWELYEYEIERENDSVTVEGNFHEWDDGDFVVYKANDGGWAVLTVYPTSVVRDADIAFKTDDGFDEVARVKGVVDWERSEVGVMEWVVEVDKAESSIDTVTRETRRVV